MTAIEFDGQVAVVTGAGQGLGRAYSLELARRGARVVVNDLQREKADEVVSEIAAVGGEAVASYDSVAGLEGAKAMVAVALERYGRVDALVNNAGVMRNGLIEDLSPEQLQIVLDVNLSGPFFATQAAWPSMRSQGYGRIVMTCSSGGLFAMQGESNYAASKAGVYGLCKALASEGAPHGVLVNALLPMAQTTLSADDPVPGHAERYPAWVRTALQQRRTTGVVAPFVAYLSSAQCKLSGEAFSVGFGRFARVFVGETRGWSAGEIGEVSAEEAAAHLGEIRSLDGFGVPADIYEQVEFIARAMGVEAPDASAAGGA